MFAARLLTFCIGLAIASVAHAQVPPYPPPMPAEFPSAAAFVDYSTARLAQLTARERGLIRAGRPDNYGAQLGGSIALVAVGGGAAAFGVFFGLFALASDTGDERVAVPLLSAAAAGGCMLIGGFTWMIYLKYSNPYREEIRALHSERGWLNSNIKRARRDARYDLSFNGLQVHF